MTGTVKDCGTEKKDESRRNDGERDGNVKAVIHRGAEAVLYLSGDGTLVKDRVKKGYRIPELDKTIRRKRTKRELRLLEKARRSGVAVPRADPDEKSGSIIRMERIKGKTVKDLLKGLGPGERDEIAERIGAIAAALHSSNVIHGDLTTSNMIFKDDDVYLIDFGLGKVSHKVEDKATDLFLLWEALLSTHFEISGAFWKKIINTYAQKYSTARDVLQRLESISKRRRYK